MNTIWNENTKRWVWIILPLVLALISALVVSRFAASADFHEKTITALDDKKATVLELTAASTAASAAITLLPGDTATPIAEKLADMSTYFLIVLCAIYVEKYLVTVTGYASFVILIPIACVLYSAGTAIAKDAWKKLARKFALFAIAIVLVIPASVKVSDLIEHTYQSSIRDTVDAAKEATKDIQNSDISDNSGVLSCIISGIKNGVSDITDKVENVINQFIEVLAVMLVTSCVIPILVLVFFFWLAKSMLGMERNKNVF